MVDSIGQRPLDRKIGAVSRVGTLAAAKSVTKQPQAAQAPTVAAQLAAAAPVDTARVERIKQAIAKGEYPLSPTTIADTLIAARYEWMSHDQA
ncbi:flagellar biosynthesis anti-sigma factor FlgM [Sphingomonas dokdonensis]|uniref:Negative regulator of flagellin synthesis n=1 Tax=Sphingomonas dokdonensis TaxID=344880 RepID=A0A245ZNC8_9SPHN|nr:flagellar biosynthesis anti-sigma factor FlgM [Sphingomonas dokdonensis]OWK31237.1 anti-sigma-28 factor, FlgM [Sphingomonas dokdonensis]